MIQIRFETCHSWSWKVMQRLVQWHAIRGDSEKEVHILLSASLKVCIQGTFLNLCFNDCRVSFSWTRGLGLFSVLCTGLHDVTCMTCCLEDNCVACTAIMDHSMQLDC